MSRRQEKRERVRRLLCLMHSAPWGRRMPHAERVFREMRREARRRILEVLSDGIGPNTLRDITLVLSDIEGQVMLRATVRAAPIFSMKPIAITYRDDEVPHAVT